MASMRWFRRWGPPWTCAGPTALALIVSLWLTSAGHADDITGLSLVEDGETQERSSMQTRRVVWIDTDTSVAPGGHELDDGLALVQAFHSPELEVRGVSAVFGNAPIADAFSIAAEIVGRFGPADLEVFEGAAGPADLGKDTSGSRALAEALRREKLTILPIGPVTNIATVLTQHPELAGQVEEIVAVAGRRPGQRFRVGSRPDARTLRDLNFELDAESFQVLLDADVPLVLAPFEISSKVLVTAADVAAFGTGPEPLRWFVQPVADWLEVWRDQFGVDGFHPFDTLAVAYVTSPEWVSCEDLPAEIQQLPDDTQQRVSAGVTPLKPYLLVSDDLQSGRRVRYCHDIAPEFKDDLLARLLE